MGSSASTSKKIDRSHFLPKGVADQVADNDGSFRVRNFHQSSRKMYEAAIKHLELRKGNSFLNIGSGTGYFSTLVEWFIGPSKVHHGIELFEDVVEHARGRYTSFCLNLTDEEESKHYGDVLFFHGNALLLDTEECGTYDRIYVGAGCTPEHQLLFQTLLNVGGILVGPFDGALLKIQRLGPDTFSTTYIQDVNVPPLLAEPKFQASLPKIGKTFNIGDCIEARTEKRPSWYEGEIININPSGSYDVRYCDGDEELDVQPDCIRNKQTMSYDHARLKLKAFYQKVNPEKVQDIDLILHHYADDYDTLFYNIEAKYGKLENFQGQIDESTQKVESENFQHMESLEEKNKQMEAEIELLTACNESVQQELEKSQSTMIDKSDVVGVLNELFGDQEQVQRIADESTYEHIEEELERALMCIRKAKEACIRQAVKTRRGNPDCVICMDSPKEVVLNPCKHFCVCLACSWEIIQCPMCQKTIHSTDRIYAS